MASTWEDQVPLPRCHDKYGQELGYQMWTEETPRDYNSVKKVKLRGSNIHQSTKLRCKNSQGCLRTILNGCFYMEYLLRTFLSKTTSLNRDLILKSLKSFLVLPSFARTVEYICNFFKSFNWWKLLFTDVPLNRCYKYFEKIFKKAFVIEPAFYCKRLQNRCFPENFLEIFTKVV